MKIFTGIGFVSRPLLAGVLAFGVALPAAAPAWAQVPTLADIAKKEEERRKALKTPGKVYTKDVLPKGAAAPVPLPAPAAPADQAKPAEPEKPKEEAGEVKDEAWWRARVTQVREELRRNEMFIEALQSRINSLAADFSSRDDPYQRAKIGEDRNKAIAEMQRVAAENEALKKQLADIEEEARQAGVPPGWIR